MKLIRFGEAGKEKPGVIIGEKSFDVSAYVKIMMKIFLQTMASKIWKRLLEKTG